ncbi:protein FAM210B, mitochondrial [Tympanuchus pallidicinctus]|uniref:protein FAM210B, mitochondrial n=1 Tax=Tympanuchus pallidicinctus TaxID=109042 RepID=UPI00228715B9|nr:protein FAM210B, mitochondrial [Tympanuchus pallidicinctus]
MFRLLRPGPLRPPLLPRRSLPAAAFRPPGSEQRFGRPLLSPAPPCRVALRAATGIPAKDAGSPEKTATDLSGENKKLNKSQQLKQVFKQYGAVGVSFHVGISLISLGIFYVAVSSGVDMTPVLIKLGFSESSLQSKMAAGTSTFVLAYAVHKLFAPLRISITVVSVPFVVRYCRKIGFFKPPAPKP